MSLLRTILLEAEYTCITTYIQSGNLIVHSSLQSQEVAADIRFLVQKHFNLQIPVFCLSKKELTTAVKTNPFLKDNTLEGKNNHLIICQKKPKPDLIALLELEHPNQNYAVHQQFIYLQTPNGLRNSKYHSVYFEKQLKVLCTSRNWNTVTRIYNLLA